MSREKQLVKNTVIVAVGKICTQFISFFLLPLYTALLSTEEYGIVDLLNTYMSLLIPVLFLQISQAVFRFLIDCREDEESKKKLISTSLLTVFMQSILFLVIYLLIAKFINNEYKYFLVLNVIATVFSNLFLQISRGLGDNVTYSLGSLVSGTGTVILNVLFIAVFKLGAYGMLSSNLIDNILCVLFVFFRIKIYKFLKIKYYSKNDIKKMWKYSIPLVPNQLSWWIINASDRLIITHILGIGLNGVYSAANKFSGVCITFFNIFNMTWSESASIHIKDKDSSEFFSNIVNTTLKLFIALCLGIIAFMPFVFKFLITGEGYSPAFYQIPILMLSTIFSVVVSLFGSVYVALKKSDEIAKTSIYSAIINIIVNLALIKFIGLYAASISTLIAYLAMAIYRYFDVQKYVKIKIEKKMLIVSIIVAAAIVAIYYSKLLWLYVFGAIISVIFALIYNIDMIKNMLLVVKKKFFNK